MNELRFSIPPENMIYVDAIKSLYTKLPYMQFDIFRLLIDVINQFNYRIYDNNFDSLTDYLYLIHLYNLYNNILLYYYLMIFL